MGVLLMVLSVLALFGAKSLPQVLASTVVLIFGLWMYGAFDTILGVY